MSRNIVPRSDKDADLGTSLKNWNNVYTDKLTANAITLSGSDLQALLDGKTDLDTLAAQGDLYVATGAGVVTRLPKGNDGEILKVNSGTTEGLQWAPGGERTELDSDLIVTVGSAGDYATINDALESVVALYYPKYISDGNCPKVTIKLLAGFVMAEQVLVAGLDLSWIEINGVDAETTITRSALTTPFDGRYPAFGVSRGTMPTIGQLFSMDTSGTATNRDGISVISCSKATVLEGCGVKGAGSYGIRASYGSTINAQGANASGAGTYGILASNGSTVDAQGANASGAGSDGIRAYHGSIVNANGANASGAGSDGIRASYGSTINAQGANASGAGSYGIRASYGSTVNANGATGTLTPTPNTLTLNGIIFQ